MFDFTHRRHDRVNTSTALPPRSKDRYAGQAYDYGGTYASLPPCYSSQTAIASRSPPPPYDENPRPHKQQGYTMSPRPQMCQSQQHLPVNIAERPRRQKDSRASHVNATRLQKPNPYRREKTRNSDANLLGRPLPSFFNDCPVVRTMNQSAAACDRVAARVNEALAQLDAEEQDLEITRLEEDLRRAEIEHSKEKPSEQPRCSTIDFRKTWQYANSRLPPHMPPMKMYMATWQIVCMAAQASLDVYRRPQKEEKEDYVKADWRQGTKAMVINSRPVDDRNIIVIAIRGSRWNIIDWAVNFRPAPSEPIGFLDDEGNACHAGFLQVARAMVAPIATRLRNMLEQNPSRASSSLLFTGHSAGGAVASLLYMHMMATTFESELNLLTGCFKRVHCVTFGTPPLTFLPLHNPPGKKYERNVFLTFANEGDPVVRADRQYLSTLTRIIAAPSPLSDASPKQRMKQGNTSAADLKPLKWEVPPATLSNAGRMVLLRERPGKKGTVEAVQVTDEQLREVIFGDPEMHHMDLYKRRIDELAIAAVTGAKVS
ncbi:unnamed protein product [Zymoseptoria tritici ST99CH_1E4]|uniref:Fungal lipase-type domain-containing protein n=1 Tax=Zymoseptoria tritici ST99CH_1E4 TaxID=1276532 RepID=A0A2H1G4N2_ZYMTR|nr:unnamed protein product [Zymoseptoria tritici ST99CH_1E4]